MFHDYIMKLTTQIPIKKQSDNLINYHSKIVLFGSCFAEHIAGKFKYFKFQGTSNPFGILYHPIAIENLIVSALKQRHYDESDVFFHNERWHSFDAHSVLSSSSKEELLKNLNFAVQSTYQGIKESTHIIMTLGTAWSYKFLETGSVVANCHKVPQNQFKKELQSVQSITYSLKRVADMIQSVNPNATIIFTVSPVRHIKDGFVENTRSKAHLITAIHSLLDEKSESDNFLNYFPSFEIMMDELRDYRFYSEDMLHPNQTAVNYIWNRFKAIWISESSQETMLEVDSIQKGVNHKPFNPKSEQHQAFLSKLEAQKNSLKARFPHLSF